MTVAHLAFRHTVSIISGSILPSFLSLSACHSLILDEPGGLAPAFAFITYTIAHVLPYSCATRTLSWRPFFFPLIARWDRPSLLTPPSRVCFFVYAHWKYHLTCKVLYTIRAIPISSYGLKVVVRYLILLF